MTDLNLNKLATEIHDSNVNAGWWDAWPNKIDRFETAMMLVISELSEAMEGDRKNLLDNHLPRYKMFDVELADALIRLLDLAGAYDIKFDNMGVPISHEKNKLRDLKVTEQLYKLCQNLCERAWSTQGNIALSIVMILALADIHKFDIFEIVQEKREYNATRADHKRENRDTVNGKKY